MCAWNVGKIYNFFPYLKLYSNFVFYLANDYIFKIHRSISQGGFVGTKVLQNVNWYFFLSPKCILIHKFVKCYIKLKSICELLIYKYSKTYFTTDPIFVKEYTSIQKTLIYDVFITCLSHWDFLIPGMLKIILRHKGLKLGYLKEFKTYNISI